MIGSRPTEPESRTTTEQAVVSSQLKLSYARLEMLSLLLVVTVINYLHRHCLSVGESFIRADLGLTLEEMGLAMGIFMLPYSLFQVPAGWLGMIWGTRRALSTYIASWSAIVGGISLADSGGTLLGLRVAMGAAQSGTLPCALQSIAHWFPIHRNGVTSGLLGCAMSVGAAVSATLTGTLLTYLEWRTLFVVYMVPGLLFALVFYLRFRDDPSQLSLGQTERQQLDTDKLAGSESGEPSLSLKPCKTASILASPTGWALCIQQIFRGIGFGFFVSWFPTFLRESTGVSVVASGLLTALPLLADMVGRLAGGLASDAVLRYSGSRQSARAGVACSSLLLCVVSVLCAHFWGNTPYALTGFISFGALFAGMSSPCALSACIDIAGNKTAVVFAAVNGIGGLEMFGPLLAAWIVRLNGGWESILFFYVGAYLTAALAWFFVDVETPFFERDPSLCSAA